MHTYMHIRSVLNMVLWPTKFREEVQWYNRQLCMAILTQKWSNIILIGRASTLFFERNICFRKCIGSIMIYYSQVQMQSKLNQMANYYIELF